MRFENLVFTTIMFPLLGAAIALCAKLLKKHVQLSKFIEYLGAAIGLILPWVALIQLFPLVLDGQVITGVIGQWYGKIGISFRFDGLAWLIHLLGFTIGLAAYIYSLGGGPKGPAFTAIYLIQIAALAATIMTTDLFNLFVCLEVLGITSYVLIPTSKKPGASLAAFSYLMVSATAMVFFLLGTYALYRLTGQLSYDGIAEALLSVTGKEHTVSLMALAILVAAIAIRVAVMPLYGWLPDAHALAPHSVSAVLSGVLIKTPLFALSRVLMLFAAGSEVGHLMSIAGGITALVAVLIALSQSDAKRLLAYHSISQIGYVVAAWGMAIQLGPHTTYGSALMVGAYLHALFHAIFKGLLFLSVGTTIDVTRQRNVYTLRGSVASLRRAGERIPITFITFLIGALAISAIPPLNGYISKNAITYALKDSNLYYLLTAAGVGTVASFIKLSRIYWPSKAMKDKVESDTQHNLTLWPRQVAQLLLATLCIIGGIQVIDIFPMITNMLVQREIEIVSIAQVYSSDLLIKTLFTTLGGVMLFLVIQHRFATKILSAIKNRRRNFQGLFLSFSLGTATLALWLILST